MNTHRRFIEALGGIHAQVLIYSNYIRFIQSIRKSKKLAAIYLLEKIHLDLTTVTGQNVRHILDQAGETDIFKIKPKQFKHKFKFEELPAEENWKVQLIKDIVDVKHNTLVITNDEDNPDENPIEFTKEELDAILHYVCTS